MGKLTSSGYEKSTPLEIYDLLKREAEASIPNFTSIPSEIRENLLQMTVQPCLQFEEGITYLMNGISPAHANDEMFYNLGMTFGVLPQTFVKGQVVLNFVGTLGTVIPAGTKAKSTAITVTTNADTIINSTGNASVLAFTDDNVTTIPANTINVMITQIIGVTSVNNNNDGVAEIPDETLLDYKKRVYSAIQSPRNGSIANALTLLGGITGVNLTYTNIVETEVTVAGKTYPCVSCIVAGGDDYEVGYALFKSFWSPTTIKGVQSNALADRTISTNLIVYGNAYSVSFVRPKLLSMELHINIYLNTFLRNQAIIQGYLEEPFLKYINNLQLGTTFTRATLDDLVYDNLKANNIQTSYIDKLDYVITLNGVTVTFDAKNRLPIMFDEYLTLVKFIVAVSQ